MDRFLAEYRGGPELAYMLSTEFPSLDPATGRLRDFLSCRGCRFRDRSNEGSYDHDGWYLKDFRSGFRYRAYTREQLLRHFQICPCAQFLCKATEEDPTREPIESILSSWKEVLG